jgi:hypothetical protein
LILKPMRWDLGFRKPTEATNLLLTTQGSNPLPWQLCSRPVTLNWAGFAGEW